MAVLNKMKVEEIKELKNRGAFSAGNRQKLIKRLRGLKNQEDGIDVDESDSDAETVIEQTCDDFQEIEKYSLKTEIELLKEKFE